MSKLRWQRGGLWQKIKGRKWIIALVIVVLALAPFAWHMNKLALAVGDYQVDKARNEIAWFNRYGGVLNRLPVVRDYTLWLRLVTADEQSLGSSLVQTLAQYRDDKHRFWLFLWEMKQGDLGQAQQVLVRISEPPRKNLGQAILALAQGETAQAKEALAAGPRGLSRGEEALWHLAWVEVAMRTGAHSKAVAELRAAEKLGPQNPAYLDTAYAHAIWSGDWAAAKKISQTIDAQTWRPLNRYYLVTNALLAIQRQDYPEVQNLLGKLNDQTGSDKYLDYIQGIFSLSQGDVAMGKAWLDKALQAGLDGQFKEDAARALSQIEERLAADKHLKVLD